VAQAAILDARSAIQSYETLARGSS
jgi:hypothetical protein